MSAKYIFVTGGVVSSLGKGLAAASIGCLLEARGIKINLMKFDPYLNVDPGTMSPFQHGEVFVTDDGAETDLDLGHYERFTHARLTRAITTSPPAASTSRSSPRSAAATISARPCRSSRTSPTRSKTPCARSPPGLRGRHRRDRRNRRRHRVASVPRSHPPDAPGTRPREHLSSPT